MCGIFQVFSKNRPIDRGRFADALGLLKHRGPDHTGVRFHEQPLLVGSGVAVHIASGHQRLAILDLDERSHQPFCQDGRCLIFNGEIYNFRELRAELDDGHTSFTTTGDTEVLFRGLGRAGLDFLERANGMWAFTYLDEAHGRVLASRDRYGKKPIFYYQDQEVMIFSSIIMAILCYLGRAPRLRDDSVTAYLTHGVMFPGGDETTHVESICQIPAGHSLTLDLHRWTMELRPYFKVANAVRAGPPAAGELPRLFRDAVEARLVSDRKVGLLLSGGVDSTAVLSVLHSLGRQDQVHCFIGETGRSEDAEYAQKCVRQLGIKATVVNLEYGRGTFARVLKLCRHYEKPFPLLGSSMGMSEMFERVAEHDVPVVLDGTGGDEVFGGYWERYYPIAVREALALKDWGWLADSWKHASAQRGLMLNAGLESLLLDMLGACRIRTLRKRFSPAPVTLGLHRRKPRSPDPLGTPPRRFTEALVLDASPGGQLGEWIWHNDRNAMMSGVENRSPLLDFRLIPFMASGYATKFHREWNKHQLRTMFDAFTPLPTQWRQQKQGFRWNRKAFIRENRDAILELIASSQYLAARFNAQRFVDRARTSRTYLFSGVTTRLLCIAALEAEMGIASG